VNLSKIHLNNNYTTHVLGKGAKEMEVIFIHVQIASYLQSKILFPSCNGKFWQKDVTEIPTFL
jgi:hypothetical protein